MQSAKALWQFQAADTRVTSKGPLSVWKIGYMAADLVLEEGQWKVLNLLYAVDIDHLCAEPWTDASKYTEQEEFAAFAIPEPVPNVPEDNPNYKGYHEKRDKWIICSRPLPILAPRFWTL